MITKSSTIVPYHTLQTLAVVVLVAETLAHPAGRPEELVQGIPEFAVAPQNLLVMEVAAFRSRGAFAAEILRAAGEAFHTGVADVAETRLAAEVLQEAPAGGVQVVVGVASVDAEAADQLCHGQPFGVVEAHVGSHPFDLDREALPSPFAYPAAA